MIAGVVVLVAVLTPLLAWHVRLYRREAAHQRRVWAAIEAERQGPSIGAQRNDGAGS
jgi:hypothetical protein